MELCEYVGRVREGIMRGDGRVGVSRVEVGYRRVADSEKYFALVIIALIARCSRDSRTDFEPIRETICQTTSRRSARRLGGDLLDDRFASRFTS